MIRRLLIANRGEIASRIARTASSMGIAPLGVYAEPDTNAPCLRDMDSAVALPGRTAAETYLDIGALLLAARRVGADAVHPGYGFLSERPEFAQAVMDAGLIWVGPPPDVIASMGDKLAAKRIMSEAGVPVLPTWDADDPDVKFPVLVKASAGGGGKGMRIVEGRDDLAESIAAARREAQAAFGDPTVFLERYVSDARHVEIQLLADAHGSAVHCFERDCSIQRRHQKVIEESPSPAVDTELRDRMGAAALAAAKAVGYRNAGTVEFVLEPSGEFWFLEVNARLQVEHPVTEAVTGLDLVREQLLFAQGEPLSFSQTDLSIDGHAIEARVYAENPATGFLPATGTLVEWKPAGGVRWDSGVETGTMVGTEFDPMLAKVIAHAPTREQAASVLARALQESRIRGFATNRDFLVAALRHPTFLGGGATTSFVHTSGVQLVPHVSAGELREAAIAAALSAQHRARSKARVLRSIQGGWRNSVMPPEVRRYQHGDDAVEVAYRAERDGRFRFGDESVRLLGVDDRWVEFEHDRKRHRMHVLASERRAWVQGPDGDVALTELPRFPEPDSDSTLAGALRAPMPGKVIAVAVQPGQDVEQGDLLLVVEAMKMEHRVTAPHAGTVSEVRANVGDQVSGGDLLVVLDSR